MNASPTVIVAGGGPAGLAAAAEAAKNGAAVLLIEEWPRLGGQLCYRVQPIEAESGRAAERPADLARRLIEDAEASGVEVRTSSFVAGIYGGVEVAIVEAERHWRLVPDAIILATGSTDLPFPFVGATLPGVFTRRATQRLLNDYRVRPGRRFAIVGAGPGADELEIDILLAGGEVVWRGIAPAPLLRAEGRQGVRRFTVGHEQFDADIVVIAVGRQSDSALATMAGTAMAFAPELGGWVPVVDQQMRGQGARVFVAGDAAGVGSVAAAIAEGRIAGAAAAPLDDNDTTTAFAQGGQELAMRMSLRAAIAPAYIQPFE